MMIGGYEALANTQLLDFYKMLKILKLTPMGLGNLTPTGEKTSPLREARHFCFIKTHVIVEYIS